MLKNTKKNKKNNKKQKKRKKNMFFFQKKHEPRKIVFFASLVAGTVGSRWQGWTPSIILTSTLLSNIVFLDHAEIAE